MRAERFEERYLGPLRYTGVGYFVFVGALLAVIGWGFYSYLQQLLYGLEVTGLNVSIYWGLYITNFVFFVGLSAGGIIIAALANVLHVEKYRPIARISELVAIVCLLLATLFIFVSLGRPDRFHHLFLYGRLESPLIWDVIIILSYLALALGLGYFGARADVVRCLKALPNRRWLYRLLALFYTDISDRALARDKRILKILSIISIPAAVLLHSITAWILGVVKARVTWHTSLLGPLFVVSATVSGLALVICTVVLLKKTFKLEIKDETIEGLGKILALSIPILGYFLFAELLTVTYGGEITASEIFREMIGGHFAPLFWLNLLLGLIVPLLVLWNLKRRYILGAGAVGALALSLLALKFDVPPIVGPVLSRALPAFATLQPPIWLDYFLLWIFVVVLPLLILAGRQTAIRVGAAAALVVFGVFLERTNIVVLPQLHRLLSPLYPHGSYNPTLTEISITVGLYAIGILIFAVLAKLFPLVELEGPPLVGGKPARPREG